MSFREKSAWISFVLVLIVFVYWLQNFIRVEAFGFRDPAPMTLALRTRLAFVVAEVLLHIAIALKAPREARTPKDEREKLIDLKAARVGFYVLALGAWAAVGSMHLRFDAL